MLLRPQPVVVPRLDASASSEKLAVILSFSSHGTRQWSAASLVRSPCITNKCPCFMLTFLVGRVARGSIRSQEYHLDATDATHSTVRSQSPAVRRTQATPNYAGLPVGDPSLHSAGVRQMRHGSRSPLARRHLSQSRRPRSDSWRGLRGVGAGTPPTMRPISRHIGFS